VTYPRIAGRLGQDVELNMAFYHNGTLQSPYGIRRIDIYEGTIKPEYRVDRIIFPAPSDAGYPLPAVETGPGLFEVQYTIPSTFVPAQVYYDVWYYIPTAVTDPDDETLWRNHYGQFWAYDDVWAHDDGSSTRRIGFEPLDKKFRRGEISNLEVAIHPLPLYDYEFNKLAPIIPQLSPTVSIWTSKDELIMANIPCKMGIRHGRSRNSPFVVQCALDTRTLLIGTYRYIVTVNVDGSILSSDKLYFSIA
jgi:hypothetical protein